MKSIALLATALFLASAPSPDSKAITEISGGFLFIPSAQSLLAAEVSGGIQTAPLVKTTAQKPSSLAMASVVEKQNQHRENPQPQPPQH